MTQSADSPPIVHRDLCSSCGVCWEICPHNAISKVKSKNGEIYQNRISPHMTLVTGRSIPGIRETSPVVDETKKYADSISDDFDLVIIDTAAGSHCSVMTALEGSDSAIAVTEPTPMGAHDLNVIIGVLNILEIPSSIALNQSDLGDRTLITSLSKKLSIPISHTMAYSRKLAEAYSNGEFMQHPDLVDLMKSSQS